MKDQMKEELHLIHPSPTKIQTQIGVNSTQFFIKSMYYYAYIPQQYLSSLHRRELR